MKKLRWKMTLVGLCENVINECRYLSYLRSPKVVDVDFLADRQLYDTRAFAKFPTNEEQKYELSRNALIKVINS